MHQLVIIDDDLIIRKGLSTNILWEKEGFRMVGTAADGEEGLKLIHATKPNIVISDIKMPFMNGLEMSKSALANYPDMKIILLTSYDEFEFAKQALEIKVFGYLLKPVKREKLLETVKNAARSYDNEMKIQRQIRESKPLLRERFLINLLYGKYKTEKDVRDEARFLDCSFLKPRVDVLLLKIDEFYNEKSFQGVQDQEIVKFSILNLCREILIEAECETIDLGNDEIAIIISKDESVAEFSKEAADLGEKIRQRVDEFTDTTVSIGVGMVKEKFTLIHESFYEAKTVIKFRHVFGKNQVITFRETGLPADKAAIHLSEHIEDLVLKVKLGLTEEALEHLDQIKKQVLQNNFVSLSQARFLGMEIIFLTVKEIAHLENEVSEIQSKLFLNCAEIMELETINEIFERLAEFVIEATKKINNKREPQNDALIQKAIRFIESNYQKEGLSLEEIANEVHISPVYLSIIFKKKININFSDYLTDIRMKKAMELIRNSDLKTYEVAERVGYSNPQYFSVCFKKYTGFSPTDFKKC